MKKLRILITDHMSLTAVSKLKSFDEFAVSYAAGVQPTDEELKDTDVLLIRSKTRVSAELLEKARTLQLIITMTSGFDHIDLEAVKLRSDLRVLYTPEANAASAAELTWSMILALHRKLLRADHLVRKGDWRGDLPRGEQLEGKTLGIIGLGRIGRRVARMGQAVGMQVMAFDPYLENEVFEKLQVKRKGFHELLRLSSVISLHVPLSKETNQMINSGTLEWVSPGTFLVNTCRGEVCNFNDLITALDQGVLVGVGLDVFTNEPLRPSATLRQREDLIFSSHIGAFTHQALELASLDAVEKVLRFARQEETSDVLPPQADWYHSPIGFQDRS